jgi:hypothetical protein
MDLALSLEKRCPKCERLLSRSQGFWRGQSWCKTCQKADVYRWRAANLERAKVIEKASRERRRDKRCAYFKAEYQRNRVKRIEAARQRFQACKDATYRAYGGYKCVCCGETHPAFLSIDHVNNDGGKHRRSVGRGANIYTWLRDNGYPEGFQVLCHNCNHGKHLNGGVCPHVEAQYGITIREV